MGYSLTGYKLNSGDTAQQVAEILNGETEAEDYQGLTFTDAEKTIIDSCLMGEYAFEKIIFQTWIEYQKGSIQISVFADYIAIGVPYWETARDDIRQVFEIIEKITTQTAILFWDPQYGDFVGNTTAIHHEVYEYGLKATNEIMESATGSKKTWWQFWK
ncbi:MAG: hypothetical protein JNM09_08050 [Blastocatellia bacterium]|nr:hypothetical protein [Blastocatellia bacterium]